MSYYDEGFYHEPSEFEMLVDEFKGSLLKSVKEDYTEEMEKLRKENEELQSVKKNFEEIKKSYNNKKRELEYEYQNLKGNVRRERLNELMKELEVELYSVSSRGKSLPKCDKCDEQRRLNYTTPTGRETYESCECATKVQMYEPIPIIMRSFSIRDGKGFAWYKIVDKSTRDEYLSYYEDSISGNELITSEDQFKDIGYSYKTLFQTKEIAQKFCDYKNSKN